jgi:phosphohistidine phosphatase SixA
MKTLILIRHAKAGWAEPATDDRFPTAAMAVLGADIGDWVDIGAERVKLVDFKTPRELMENQPPRA